MTGRDAEGKGLGAAGAYGSLVKPWDVEEAGTIATTPIFSLRSRTAKSRQSEKHGSFVYLDNPDWVNVLAITANDEVVMIEQFRHGLAQVTLEIPGGIVDPGESPADAGMRELREETGYAGDAPEVIGAVSPNPAIQNNWCSTVLVRPAEIRAAVELDASEEIGVRLVPLAEVDALIRARVVHHALVVAAFHHLRLREV